jgi:hypothetical protein
MMTSFQPRPFKSFVLRVFRDYYTSFEPPIPGKQTYACLESKGIFSFRKSVFTRTIDILGGIQRFSKLNQASYEKNTDSE